jgi:hypothetical protein
MTVKKKPSHPAILPEANMPSCGEFLLYQTEDAQTRIQVRLIDGALWLTQKQLSDLYQKNIRTISEHIRNIYSDEELSTDLTIRKFRIVAPEGARSVERLVDHYSLEMVLAVGYRVSSLRGMFVLAGFPPDGTTSHSTKLANYASEVAGYARE